MKDVIESEAIYLKDEYIQVELLFYGSGAHCRKTVPDLNKGNYRPHLLVKDAAEYLGVSFIKADVVVLGHKTHGIAQLCYEIDYRSLIPDTDFFIMEGPYKVGEGRVLNRYYNKKEN